MMPWVRIMKFVIVCHLWILCMNKIYVRINVGAQSSMNCKCNNSVFVSTNVEDLQVETGWDKISNCGIFLKQEYLS